MSEFFEKNAVLYNNMFTETSYDYFLLGTL